MNPPTKQIEARIVNEGYSIQHGDGRWLTVNLNWTPHKPWRGVWDDLTDAELALARTIKECCAKVE